MKRKFRDLAFIPLFVFLWICALCLVAGAESYESDSAAIAAGAVARVGDAGGNGYYSTLAAALTAAADGDTVTLLADTTLGETTIEKDLTLDGAGHTLTRSDTSSTNYWLVTARTVTFRHVQLDAVNLFGLDVKSGGNVSFTDGSSFSGKGKGSQNILAYSRAGATMTVGAGCTLEVVDEPANAAVTVTVKSSGVLHVYGTIRNNSTRTNKWNRCIHDDKNGKNGCIYIYDGALIELPADGTATDDTCAIYTNGSLVMTGGRVKAGTLAKCGAIYLSAYVKNDLTFTFTGGTIESTSTLGAIRIGTDKTGVKLTLGGDVSITATNGYGVQIDGTGLITLNVTGGTITGKRGIHNTSKANITATFSGGRITGTERAISLGSGTYDVTMTGGTYTATGSDKACVSILGGANSGTKVTISGGEFIAKNKTIAALALWGAGNTTTTLGKDLVANIYGGYFTCEYLACVHIQQGAAASIYGGVFENMGNEKGDSSSGNAVRVGNKATAAGELHVYGGIFYLRGLYGGVFGVAEELNSSAIGYEYCLIDIHGYTAVGGTGAVRNYGTGTPHTAWAASRNRGTCYAPVTQMGAQVRYAEGSTGLRFVSTVSKETIDYLTGIADAGSISYGTIIAPRTCADSVSVFTAELLSRAGKKYLDISAKNGLTENEDGSLSIRAAIVNILPENFTREFAGAAYVEYRVNGVVCRMYASYQPDLNARSAEQVARMALTSGQTFTPAQTAVLNGYWNSEAAKEKVLDVYLIAGQSNASGSTYVTDAFRNSDPLFTEGYENIYYSGVSRTSVDDVLPTNKVNFVQNVKAGMGKTESFMGSELGIAKALSVYYNGTNGNEAAIIKYGAGGTRLFDNLTGPDKPEGNWTPPSWLKTHSPAGEKSGGLYRNFLSLVEETVYYYRVLGYTEINLCGIFWMQGESDQQEENVALYADLFAALVSDMRSDLGRIFDNETATAPVLVGEISKGFANEITEENLAFIELQRGLAEKVSNTYIISSSEYISGTRADDPWHWTCEDMLQIGMAVGEQFLTLKGQGGLISPPVESAYVAEVLDSDGTSVGKYVSLAWAINTAPAGATVKLLRDVTLTGSLNLGNRNAVTLDGNGYTLTVSAVDTAMRLTTVDLTFVNVKLVNTIKDKSAYGITCFAGAKLRFESGSITVNGANYAVYKATGTPEVTLADAVTVTGAASVNN